MKKFKLFSILAVCIAALSFASCDTGSDDNSSYQMPTQQEAQLMFQQLMTVSTSAGLLMPGDTVTNNNKIQKDSVLVGFRAPSAIDSTFTIMNFPVAKLAKYIKDDCVAKDIVANHDPVTLRGKMVPYVYANTLFVANPDDIVVEGNGKKVTIKFYTWNNYYSLAGIATSSSSANASKRFLMYLTPGAVVVDGNSSSTSVTPNQNLKTTMNSYGQSVPFTMFLQANM